MTVNVLYDCRCLVDCVLSATYYFLDEFCFIDVFSASLASAPGVYVTSTFRSRPRTQLLAGMRPLTRISFTDNLCKCKCVTEGGMPAVQGVLTDIAVQDVLTDTAVQDVLTDIAVQDVLTDTSMS